MFVRTGVRFNHAAGADVEVKFNPWHDVDDGRFTFVGQGRYYGAGYAAAADEAPSPRSGPLRDVGDASDASDINDTARGQGGTTGGGGASGHGYWLNPSEVAALRRKHPGTNPTMVAPGETWDTIAQRTKTARSALRLANGTPASTKLKAGDIVLVPAPQVEPKKTQAGKAAQPADKKSTIRVGRQSGAQARTRTASANGFEFTIDEQNRTIRVTGTVAADRAQAARDRRAQLAAGGNDRLPTDEGGHFVARRLNGPKDAFNHFAQDRNFNRSAYAKLENQLDQARQLGKSVEIDIVATYAGSSKRPDSIDYGYTIDGHVVIETFPNRARR
jgi:hypothetical protein